jgi:hypothetical protein
MRTQIGSLASRVDVLRGMFDKTDTSVTADQGKTKERMQIGQEETYAKMKPDLEEINSTVSKAGQEK